MKNKEKVKDESMRTQKDTKREMMKIRKRKRI